MTKDQSSPITVKVQTEDFSQDLIYKQLASTPYCGAIVTFVGLVRDHPELELKALELEHYPGMTEQCLYSIAEQAIQRFSLKAVQIVHRVGYLTPEQQIVVVGVAAGHRSEAFAGAEFLMDYLKNQVPIWKKQHDASGTLWVEAKTSDQQQYDRWSKC